MAKRKQPTKTVKLNHSEYPLIGYEYEYLGHPVKVTRVCPSVMGERFSHVEFENRYYERSSCDSGELTLWQDVDKPLTKNQSTMVMLCLRDAIEDATTDAERRLAKWQIRRLLKKARSK